MNRLGTRIAKLEQASGASAIVSVPSVLDALGVEFASAPAHDEVHAVRFTCDQEELLVRRTAKESFPSFETRAMAEAKRRLDCLVVLPMYAKWI